MDEHDIGWRNGWAGEDFGLEVGQMWWLIFVQSWTPNPISTIHMDQMILSEPSIIIIWTYQDMMGWMRRMLVWEMSGADVENCSVVGEL
jgi:hypothetical protein